MSILAILVITLWLVTGYGYSSGAALGVISIYTAIYLFLTFCLDQRGFW